MERLVSKGNCARHIDASRMQHVESTYIPLISETSALQEHIDWLATGGFRI